MFPLVAAVAESLFVININNAMNHFAQIDSENKVVAVIIAEQDFINTLPDKDKWICCTGPDDRYPLVGEGAVWTGTAWYIPPPPKPNGFSSWVWDGTDWIAPTPYPTDGKNYIWDEPTVAWVLAPDLTEIQIIP